MKRQKILNGVCSVLLVGVFAFMSLASSSTSKGEPAQDNGGGGGSTTTNAPADTKGGTTDQSTSDTPAPSKKSSFAVTNSNVIIKKNSLKENVYFAVVEVTNTGDTYLKVNEGQLDFEDNDKNYLMSSTEYGLFTYAAPELIGPNEKGYIYSFGNVDEGTSVKNGVNINTQNITCTEVDDSSAGYYDLEVSGAKVKKDALGYVNVAGKVTNNSDKDRTVNIYALLYNKKGKIIGAVENLYVSVEAGKSKGFKLTSLYIHSFASKKDVDHFEIFARATDTDLNWSLNLGDKISATPLEETTEPT